MAINRDQKVRIRLLVFASIYKGQSSGRDAYLIRPSLAFLTSTITIVDSRLNSDTIYYKYS